MKKFFAIAAALLLTPTFQANAWIGGPFSGNAYFGENGDDGVYEAIATATNGIGLFRIVVGNEFRGSPADTPTTAISFAFRTGNNVDTVTFEGINSGNIFIGGFGSDSASWYIEGKAYFGQTRGTVNSAQGSVLAVSSATAADGSGDTIGAFFQGRLNSDVQLVPASGFNGQGEATITTTAGDTSTLPFTVVGTKVSNNIFFGF